MLFRPDLFLDELKKALWERLGVEADESTIWKALHRSGFTMKQVRYLASLNFLLPMTPSFLQLSKAAIERNEDRRAAFRYTYGLTCTPENTVFVDESSFDRRTSLRRKGWAPRGRRAERHWFFVRGRR